MKLFIVSSLHNELVIDILFLSGLQTQSRFTPRSNRARTSNRRFTFTTAVRMVARVHNRTSDRRSPAHMAFSSGLTNGNVLMIQITDLADSCHTIHTDQAYFAGRKPYLCVVAFFCHQLCRCACGSHQLAAFTGHQLNVVDQRTNRDELDLHRVTRLDVRAVRVCNQKLRRPSRRSARGNTFFRRPHTAQVQYLRCGSGRIQYR